MKIELHTVCTVSWFMMSVIIMLTGHVNAAVDNKLETCGEEKSFKTMLKARPNLLVLFVSSGEKL